MMEQIIKNKNAVDQNIIHVADSFSHNQMMDSELRKIEAP